MFASQYCMLSIQHQPQFPSYDASLMKKLGVPCDRMLLDDYD